MNSTLGTKRDTPVKEKEMWRRGKMNVVLVTSMESEQSLEVHLFKKKKKKGIFYLKVHLNDYLDRCSL